MAFAHQLHSSASTKARSSFSVHRSAFLSAFYFLLSTFTVPLVAQTSPAPPTPATSPDPRQTQHYIGVAVENIPPTIGRLMRLAPGQGLLVAKVIPGSPAEAARLQSGDLLISINGQPLTAQRQLVDVTNALEQTAQGLKPKPARIAYVRDGQQTTVEIVPVARPASMLVTGNANGFTPDTAKTAPTPYAYAPIPNNASIMVGPGIVIDITPPSVSVAGGASSAATQGLSYNTQSVQQLMAKGQTIVFSQETDSLGHVHYTLTQGSKTYDIDPGHLDNLPPELRPLAEPLFSRRITVSPAPNPGNFATVAATQTIEWLEERIAAQDRKIDELTEKINVLIVQLNEKAVAPHP